MILFLQINHNQLIIRSNCIGISLKFQIGTIHFSNSSKKLLIFVGKGLNGLKLTILSLSFVVIYYSFAAKKK